MWDSTVDKVAFPVGNSLIINLPGNLGTTSNAFSFKVLGTLTGILVKKASYRLPTYSSPNSKV